MKKTLFLTRTIPDKQTAGGDIPILFLQMAALSKYKNMADLLFLRRSESDNSKIETVKNDLGFENIFYADIEPKINLKCLFNWAFNSTSYIFNRFYSKSYSDKILELLKTGNYLTIVISAAYLYINIYKNKKLKDEIKSRNIKCILGVQVFEHKVIQEYLELTQLFFVKKLILKREALLIKKLELSFIEETYKSFFVGKEDLNHANKLVSNKNLKLLEIIPDLNSYEYCKPELEEENSIYFVGSYSWKPNIDAVKYFIESVFTIILTQNPNAKLYLIGAGINKDIEKLHNGKNIFFKGKVESVIQESQKYSIMIAPLRIGGGTRIKIIEALSCGKAIVATSKAVEGINMKKDTPLIIEDTPEIFAKKVLELLDNKEDKNNLKQKARNFAKNHFIFENFQNNFLQILDMETKK